MRAQGEEAHTMERWESFMVGEAASEYAPGLAGPPDAAQTRCTIFNWGFESLETLGAEASGAGAANTSPGHLSHCLEPAAFDSAGAGLEGVLGVQDTQGPCSTSGGSGSKKKRGPRPRLFAKNRCQVDGCETDLSDASFYYQRNHICVEHLKQQSIVVRGVESRFCQRCGVSHPLCHFQGKKKSCMRALARHKQRRLNKQLSGPLALKDLDPTSLGPELGSVADVEQLLASLVPPDTPAFSLPEQAGLADLLHAEPCSPAFGLPWEEEGPVVSLPGEGLPSLEELDALAGALLVPAQALEAPGAHDTGSEHSTQLSLGAAAAAGLQSADSVGISLPAGGALGEHSVSAQARAPSPPPHLAWVGAAAAAPLPEPCAMPSPAAADAAVAAAGTAGGTAAAQSQLQPSPLAAADGSSSCASPAPTDLAQPATPVAAGQLQLATAASAVQPVSFAQGPGGSDPHPGQMAAPVATVAVAPCFRPCFTLVAQQQGSQLVATLAPATPQVPAPLQAAHAGQWAWVLVPQQLVPAGAPIPVSIELSRQ